MRYREGRVFVSEEALAATCSNTLAPDGFAMLRIRPSV